MIYRFTIHGEPVGKGRPRFTRTGHTYTPEKTREYERRVAQLYRVTGGKSLGAAPVSLAVTAYFAVPKSASKKTKAAMLSGETACMKKPDADNILKCIADALNGVAYDDDKQIVQTTFSKHWSEAPRVEVEVSDELLPVEKLRDMADVYAMEIATMRRIALQTIPDDQKPND